MVTALVTAVAVVEVIAAAASASAEPDGKMTVKVLKYPTPEFGVRLTEIVNGTLSRPGVSGDSRSWEDLSYGTCQQVPRGASGAGGAHGR